MSSTRSSSGERTARLAAARAQAAELARRFDVALPVPVEDIAQVMGAEVVIGALPDAMAQLMRWNGRARIRLSDSVAHAGARRFSIAHELGHLWLDHGAPNELERCAASVIESATARGTEAEANGFAAEMLTPAALIGAWVDRVPDLEAARALAEVAAVSVTAAARRVCEVSRHPCAVVRCHAGRVVWAARSATFPAFLPKGRVPGPDAAVTEWIAYQRLPRIARIVPASTWFGPGAPAGLELIEQSTSLPGSSDALCAIWIEPRGAHAIEKS